jgi:hypothetical protein
MEDYKVQLIRDLEEEKRVKREEINQKLKKFEDERIIVIETTL